MIVGYALEDSGGSKRRSSMMERERFEHEDPYLWEGIVLIGTSTVLAITKAKNKALKLKQLTKKSGMEVATKGPFVKATGQGC
jgi:hypothetical protein